jgi:predicted ester cyclase
MSEDLKAKVHRIYEEAYGKGNVDVLDELIADDYQRHQPPMPEVKGLDAYKKFVADVRGAYTDFELRVEEVIVEGNVTAARVTLRGKHTGQAPTIQAAPTGKQVEMTGSVISHWNDGKVTVDWAYNDYLGLLQQFGVYPPPGMFA